MKRILIILFAAICLLLLCSCNLFTYEENLKADAANHLQLNLDGATVLEEWDTHGGFHGDGETFVKLACSDGFEENLGAGWSPLPLKEDAYRLFYEWGGVLEYPETDERCIPEIENGYWYFKNTGTWNWDFAVYDCDQNILYFYEYDS